MSDKTAYTKFIARKYLNNCIFTNKNEHTLYIKNNIRPFESDCFRGSSCFSNERVI